MIEAIPVIVKFNDGKELEYKSLAKAAEALSIPQIAATYVMRSSVEGYSILPKEIHK